MDTALELGILQRKGSWFSYNDENIAQGRAKVVELLADESNGKLTLQLESQVRMALENLRKPAPSQAKPAAATAALPEDVVEEAEAEMGYEEEEIAYE